MTQDQLATGMMLSNFFKHLCDKFPGQSINSVYQNFLLMSEDGTQDNARVYAYGATFYDLVKTLLENPDTQTAETYKVVVNNQVSGGV